MELPLAAHKFWLESYKTTKPNSVKLDLSRILFLL